MNEMSKERSDQIFGGIFLIGLAILFFTGYWWPGVMFVIGIAILGRAYMQGKPLTSERGGWVVLAIGVVFALTDVLSIFSIGNWWPLILIGIGLYLLFGQRQRTEEPDEKSKRDM